VTRPLRLLDLGTRDYAETWALQKDLLAARQGEEIVDTLILVEHPPVITMGRGAHRENVLDATGVPVYEIERGGDVTYHGPGQLVGYPILLLREDERNLHLYLRRIEDVIIRALADLGLTAGRRPGWTGVWCGEHKLASIGVAVKKWVTMHGFALNVCTDLGHFAAINPCGLPATVMASVQSELGRPVAIDDVRPGLLVHFAQVFAREWQ
jgi:lipoate-protein ligase B